MSEYPVQNGDSVGEAALDERALFEARLAEMEIPPNIDPRLLALWIQREQDEIERKQRKYIKPPRRVGRKLNRLFAAYIGIAVMCLAIVLGVIQGHDSTAILKTTCVVFLVYTIIGAFVGMIAERYVHDSAEALLRDILNRSPLRATQEVGQAEADEATLV